MDSAGVARFPEPLGTHARTLMPPTGRSCRCADGCMGVWHPQPVPSDANRALLEQVVADVVGDTAEVQFVRPRDSWSVPVAHDSRPAHHRRRMANRVAERDRGSVCHMRQHPKSVRSCLMCGSAPRHVIRCCHDSLTLHRRCESTWLSSSQSQWRRAWTRRGRRRHDRRGHLLMGAAGEQRRLAFCTRSLIT